MTDLPVEQLQDDVDLDTGPKYQLFLFKLVRLFNRKIMKLSIVYRPTHLSTYHLSLWYLQGLYNILSIGWNISQLTYPSLSKTFHFDIDIY